MSAYRVPPVKPPQVPGTVLVVLGLFGGWAWASFVQAVFPS